MSKNKQPNLQSIRDGFGKGLLKLGIENNLVVALTADLGKSLQMDLFQQKFPKRFIEVGIAEQNMIGVAVGLALAGKIPFVGSFASFQPMRNLDQIRSSVCIMNANVKIISSHAGFSYPADGIQIQALEDIAIMRVLPNMQVWVPADALQAEEMTLLAAEHEGPVYIRLGREKTELLQGNKLVDQDLFNPLDIGRAQYLRRGSDLTFIACGYAVNWCLQAAIQLEGQGIYAGVVNMHTIKPIDAEAIAEIVQQVGKIVTVEEHQLAGGLGSAVSEVIMQNNLKATMRMVGVADMFGETARESAELLKSRGLGITDIIQAAREIL